jgi:hypothetical protein
MFEQTDESVDKVRSRIIMGLAGVAVALIVGAILLFGAFDSTPPEAPQPPPGLPDAKHAGDPEFDKYIGLVAVVNKKFFTQANMLGQRQAVCTGTIANFTDRTVTGVELRGTVYGAGGKVIATTLAMPVPRRFESISPKGRVDFAITIDGVPREGEIEDITVDLEGLAFAP